MKTKAFTIVEIMTVVVIIGLLVAMAIPAISSVRNRERDETAEYSAWCKLSQRSDLSLEEWRVLKKAGMLSLRTVAAEKP